MRSVCLTMILGAALALTACGDSSTPDDGDSPIDVPTTYRFESRFQSGASSVSYTGQVKRQLLIEAMTRYIGGLSAEGDPPAEGEIVAVLSYFHEFANAGGAPEDAIGFEPSVAPALQTVWGDLGELATLTDKMPENDNSFPGGVIGYRDGSYAPEAALFDMFEALEDRVIAQRGGTVPLDPTGAEITAIYVSEDGIDYQQLIQKYLLGAVALSQGADDYLDDDTPGKGLLADNESVYEEGAAYTVLEHAWDEGFGYFGAPRDYGDYTDDEIAEAGGRTEYQGAHDSDGDGAIDLTAEVVFGHAAHAAERDRGSVEDTDFTRDAFDAFLAGRTLIANAKGALSTEELTTLREHRDAVLLAWERSVAASAVHCVNDVLQDMASFGTEAYRFLDHAKHWSALEGFALALQFDLNHSPLSSAEHIQLHALIGDQPVLPGADTAVIEAYAESLRQVRTLLADAFGFAAANLGDENGEGGW